MSLIRLIAVQPLEYRGAHIEPGETFEARPVDALALTYGRQAKFPPKQPPKSKRKYRRRDMTAEST